MHCHFVNINCTVTAKNLRVRGRIYDLLLMKRGLMSNSLRPSWAQYTKILGCFAAENQEGQIPTGYSYGASPRSIRRNLHSLLDMSHRDKDEEKRLRLFMPCLPL